jgi:hypothetical protein
MTDLTIYKGIAWQRTLTVTRKDTGARRDLTGATIEFRLKRKTTDDDPPLVWLTVGSGITLLAQSGDTLGQATLDISAAASAPLNVMNHVFTVLVTPQGETVPQVAIEPTKIAVRDAP